MPNNALARSVAHYTQLARTPGWKEYCWSQVQQMAADDPTYATLPALLTEAMRGKAVARPLVRGNGAG